MNFLPAPENHGYKFQRIDIEGEPIIEADCDLVVDTSRGTTLGKGDVRIYTIEHVLAALVGMQVDNCLIKILNSDCFSVEMPRSVISASTCLIKLCFLSLASISFI